MNQSGGPGDHRMGMDVALEGDSGAHAARRWVALVVVLAAFVLRVWSLDSVPPGVTHDEAAHLHDARRIWEGYRPIYLSTAYGREPLYDYLAAPLIHWAGMMVATGRLVSAFWGTCLVALLYAWCRRAIDWPTAALAAALMAISFWPVSTSRQILRSVSMPVLETAGFLAYWRAASGTGVRRLSGFILAGVLQGLAFYTYMPARVMWMVPALCTVSLVLYDRTHWRRARLGLALMLLTVAAAAAPMLVYLAQHPELEVRVDELAAPLRALAGGNAVPLWERLGETILLFSHRGDVQWIYNIAGRPLLLPPLAVLFFFGVLLTLIGALRARGKAERFVLLWLLIGVFPALVTGLESSSLRAIGAQPAVFVLAAAPLSAVGRLVARRSGRRTRAALLLLLLGALSGVAIRTGLDYLIVWGRDANTRVAYHTHVVEIARYLDSQAEATPVTISTLYPGPLHDPYAADTVLRRVDLTLSWHDGRYALVFPDVGQARTVAPAIAPIAPSLMRVMGPDLETIDRIELEPDDLSPWFEVYAWSPRYAREHLLSGDPIDVGHVLDFVGSRLEAPTLRPGSTLDLITFWRVRKRVPDEPEIVLFTHLLDGDRVVGQADRLDVPTASWQPGYLVAQLHQVEIPTQLADGEYLLEIGAYQRGPGFPRLPVFDGDEPVDDRILLPPIQIRGTP